MSKKNLFTQVEFTKINSNTFDLSHDVKLSLKMGDLVPIMCMECIPGDKFNIGCESLLRFAPLVAPVMHRMDVTMHYFFVPYRLLWRNWENYITNTKVAGVLPAFPFITCNPNSANPSNAPLMNYMGVPFAASGTSTNISAMSFAAYILIYNEYYRDQNLITEVPNYELNDGDNTSWITPLVTMRKRSWEHDYYTSCLPTPQKGDPVNLPLSGFNDVAVARNPAVATPTATTGIIDSLDQPPGTVQGSFIDIEQSPTYGTANDAHLYAKTSDLVTSSTTVSDVRRAFKLQEWLEKAMRGGSRYIEFVRSMFGVQSSDKRLQRPEYITGVKSPVVISEVLNTTGTDDAPQGNMAGHGVSVTSGKYGSYYCEEHGLIMGIMSVMPKTAYQQGIPKHFLKINDPFEFYFEQFAHIGEQAVQNQELFAFTATGEDTFGYIPRYTEYKFQPNRVCGDFQTTLDFWHLGRQFATQPALNQTFIECTPDTRIFAVEDGSDYLWCHVYNKVKASRKMPFFGTPKF